MCTSVHICDGIKHCPNTDDEHVCDVTSCPPGCDCLAHSIICKLSLLDVFPSMAFNFVKHLAVIDSTLHLPNFYNIGDLRGLIVLNLSGNHLKEICGSLKFDKDCQFYKNTCHLRSFSQWYFTYPPSLFLPPSLSESHFLSYNPLHVLNTNAFSHPTLNYISLRGIRSLTGESEKNPQSLHTWCHQYSYWKHRWLFTIHCDACTRREVKWYPVMLHFGHHKYCSKQAALDHSCPMLLPFVIIGYIILPVGALLVLIDLAAFSLNYKYMPSAKYHRIISLLMTTDAILASYLAVLGMADISSRPNFVLTINRWDQSIFCVIMVHMTTMATVLFLFLAGLLVYHVKQAANQITLRRKGISHDIVLSKYTFIIVSTLLTALLEVTEVVRNNSIDRFLCNRMDDSRMASNTGLISVVTFSVLMILLMLAITTFTAQLLYHVRKTSKEVNCIPAIKNASSQLRAPLTRFMLATIITKWATLCPYPML